MRVKEAVTKVNMTTMREAGDSVDIDSACSDDSARGYFGVKRIGITVGNPRKLP